MTGADAHDFETVLAARAAAVESFLDGLLVEAYGSTVPLNQVGTVGVPEPRLLVVQPWDKKLVSAIEKAIRSSDLGLNPSSDGNVVRIPIPALTEERRKELVKVAKGYAEDGRISVRNARDLMWWQMRVSAKRLLRMETSARRLAYRPCAHAPTSAPLPVNSLSSTRSVAEGRLAARMPFWLSMKRARRIVRSPPSARMPAPLPGAAVAPRKVRPMMVMRGAAVTNSALPPQTGPSISTGPPGPASIVMSAARETIDATVPDRDG